MYYFLSGYTAKLAGTEIGVTEPQPTFSACFGAPFLPQPPSVYAKLLGEKLVRHPASSVWLVNTGWTGGPYGAGHRMPIQATRALLDAALSGDDRGRRARAPIPIFGFDVPGGRAGRAVERCSTRVRRGPTRPPTTRKARELAQMFRENFTRFADVSPAVAAAGPTG